MPIAIPEIAPSTNSYLSVAREACCSTRSVANALFEFDGLRLPPCYDPFKRCAGLRTRHHEPRVGPDFELSGAIRAGIEGKLGNFKRRFVAFGYKAKLALDAAISTKKAKTVTRVRIGSGACSLNFVLCVAGHPDASALPSTLFYGGGPNSRGAAYCRLSSECRGASRRRRAIRQQHLGPLRVAQGRRQV